MDGVVSWGRLLYLPFWFRYCQEVTRTLVAVAKDREEPETHKYEAAIVRLLLSTHPRLTCHYTTGKVFISLSRLHLSDLPFCSLYLTRLTCIVPSTFDRSQFLAMFRRCDHLRQ